MSAKFFTSVSQLDQLPENTKPQIALIGRSNVGKSSLVNHLTGQNAIANVSATPGRTQTLNLFDIDNRYYLVDLPGYGFAKTPKATQAGFIDLIGDYLTQTPALHLVLLIIDGSIPVSNLDRDMLEFLKSIPRPVLLVVNKVDKLSKNEQQKLSKTIAAEFPDTPSVFHSSLKSIGRGHITETIDKAVRTAEKLAKL